MSDRIVWTVVIVGLVVAGELGRTGLREWHARRKTIKRGRTLTAKYGIPWR
ncbi:MAG: hypothetical protein JO255_22130 [Alphaproteobacteria bacterium]|nr:hypothetical protein [Alphaproteobacteria bacterium]